MNDHTQIKLSELISFSLGNVDGVIDALKTTSKKDVNIMKLIGVLEIVQDRLQKASDILLQDFIDRKEKLNE